MVQKSKSKNRWLQRHFKNAVEKLFQPIRAGSERGQALIEALTLFLILAMIFSFLEYQMKNHRSEFKKHRFSGVLNEKT